MIQKVLTVPNPILREKAKPVSSQGGPNSGWDKKTLNLIKDLKDTLHAQQKPKGIGLSAPQIGVSKRVFVLELEKKMMVFINPEIIFSSKKTLKEKLKKGKRFLEGCLSVPNFWGFVDRPYEIKVAYLDQNGQKQTRKFTDRKSSFFLHEYDHLDGILFIDRILEQKGKIYRIEKNKEGEDELVEVKLT